MIRVHVQSEGNGVRAYNYMFIHFVIVTGWVRGVHGLERPQHVEM